MPSARFPGRRVVAGGFLILTTSAGFGFYGLAVYLNALSRERGWEVSSLSLATTVYFLVAGLAGLYVARLIARHDIRRVILAGGVMGGASLALLGRVSEPCTCSSFTRSTPSVSPRQVSCRSRRW